MLRVRVIALSTPHVHRHCPRCDERRPFVSSDRFRVNANKGRLDVWLVYRCADCDFTWNREVLARVAVGEVPPDRLRAYHENDRAAAWDCAFAEPGDAPFRVEVAGDDDGTVAIDMPWPCQVRLDRLLGAALRLPRSAIASRFPDAKALRRPARNGQIIST